MEVEKIQIENINMLKGEVEKQVAANKSRIEQEETAKLADNGRAVSQDDFTSKVNKAVEDRMKTDNVQQAAENFILSEHGGSLEKANEQLERERKILKFRERRREIEELERQNKERLSSEFNDKKQAKETSQEFNSVKEDHNSEGYEERAMERLEQKRLARLNSRNREV